MLVITTDATSVHFQETRFRYEQSTTNNEEFENEFQKKFFLFSTPKERHPPIISKGFYKRFTRLYNLEGLLVK